MYKKSLLSAVLAAVFAAMTVFVFTACDLPAADALLDGTWIAVSGARLEFTNGKYTRTLVTGGVETGTYNAADGYITFNRSGNTPETLPYKLNETCLTVGITEYYRNTLGIPEDIEGRWTPYPDYGVSIIFRKGKPRKGNPGIIEGDFISVMGAKGKYTITNRNLPGSSVLTTTPTHIHGSSIATFVEQRLPVNNVELFDMELLQTPGYDIGEWWFTLDEARKFFENAAGKADTLADQSRIILAMRYFFEANGSGIYDYSIEEDQDLRYDYETVADGKNKLTLRLNDPQWGAIIYTYLKLKDDFGVIGIPLNPDDPNNRWTPGWPPKPPVQPYF